MKIENIRFIGMAMIFLIAMALLPCMAQAVQDEPVVPCVEGDTLTIEYGQHTEDCAIDTITDNDFFKFDGVVGQKIGIALSETTTGAIELHLRVWDPDNIEIVNTVTNGNIYEEITLDKTGRYTIGIRENGQDETGGYMLQLEWISSINRPCIQWGNSEDDFVDQITDNDFFTFKGEINDFISIALSETTTGAIELHLRVWEPDGTEIVNTVTNGNIFEEITLAKKGKYTIGIRENGQDETGGYRLQLECPFGDCPPCPDQIVRKYIDTTSCPDTNADGCPDVAALLTANGKSFVTIKDGCDGSFIRSIQFFNTDWRPVAIACIPDIPDVANSNMNGISELVVLAVNKKNGNVVAKIKDAQTKELLNTIWFYNKDWNAKGLTGVMDTNSSGVYELAVLAVKKIDGKVRVKLKDALTKELLATIPFPKSK